MSIPRGASAKGSARFRAGHGRLELECLEARTVPSGAPQAGHTLDQAPTLGSLQAPGASLEILGAITNTPQGAGNIDWYSFTLNQAARVVLATHGAASGSTLVSVLSIYDNDTDTFSSFGGHRLIAHDDGIFHGGDAQVVRDLAPGTYFVAVTGSRNSYFYPFLASSGYPGSIGSYDLTIQDLQSLPGPIVRVDASPLSIRLATAALLNQTTLHVDPSNGQNVFLTRQRMDVPLAFVNYSVNAQELQLFPQGPLAAGDYTLSIAPLDYSATFHINSPNGKSGADDTLATAQNLTSITNAGLIERAGTIGTDSYYQLYLPYSNTPATILPNYAGNDVDLYHFQIIGSGQFAVSAEVFAGRINSTLDPVLTLFDRTGSVIAVADNSTNGTVGTDGQKPLFNDPLLFVGLQAGDYYLGVSSHGNQADPSQGVSGYNPTVSHSGQGGTTTGDYVLNLAVVGDNVPPTVTTSSISEGATLPAAPTTFRIQFSKDMNLVQLGYQIAQVAGQSFDNALYFIGSDGSRYQAKLVDYNSTTHEASFLMLDGLSTGAAELHLVGNAGLMDFAGNPLTAIDPSGDFIVHFTIGGPIRGTGLNRQKWYDQEPNNTFNTAQVIGALYPNELSVGPYRVHFIRPVKATATDTADYYQFQVLEDGTYSFGFSSFANGIMPTRSLTDSLGSPVTLRGARTQFAHLQAGVIYVLRLGWRSVQASKVGYDLRIAATILDETPTPLTTGPAPALRLRLGPDLPTPAGLTVPPSNGVVPALHLGRDAFTLFGIPAGLLIELSAGPVGGAVASTETGVHSTGNKLVLTPNDVARISIRAVSDNASADSSADPPSVTWDGLVQWIEDWLHCLETRWKPSLDTLFRSGDWMKDIPPVSSVEDRLEEDEADLEDISLRHEAFDDLDGNVFIDGPSSRDLAWMGSFAAAGILTCSYEREPNRLARETGQGKAVSAAAC
jgi:hypothetical protein